jgi:hypothetical protein
MREWLGGVVRPWRRSIAVLGLLLAAGCGTVHIEVPPGRTVTMLDQDQPASVRIERHIWFALWGGEPLSDNSTLNDVKEHHLTQVRVTVVQNVWDSVINAFTCYFSFVRRTVIIEGNSG